MSAQAVGGRGVSWSDGLIIAAVVGLAKADAAAVGVVAPVLRTDLHLSEAQLGLLASVASGTGALCALPAGALVDRRHRTAVVTAALVLWSAAFGLAGFATGLTVLAIARLLSGGIATIARPVAVSLAGDVYASRYRGRALALLDAGQAVGTAGCFLLGALAAGTLGWRWLFWWLAAGGLLLAVVSRRLSDPAAVRDPGPALASVLKTLLRIRTNVIVLAADSVGNFFYAGVASFAVLYMTQRYGLSTSMVDALAPVIAVGVVFGILAGGRAGDRLALGTGGGARRLALASACQLVAACTFALSLMSASVVVAGVLLFAGATALGGAGPCLDAVRVDIVQRQARGRAEAARGLLTLASSALGPLTFGLLAGGLGRKTHGVGLRDAFLIMLVPLAAGALMLLTGIRSYPADEAAARRASGRGVGRGRRASR